jgi:hypothetical protein
MNGRTMCEERNRFREKKIKDYLKFVMLAT